MEQLPAASKLTSEQRAAVEAQARFVLVVAGPGAGKTHTLVARAAELVRRGVPPSTIFVATFARKAATQAKERLEAIGLGEARASTLHSYAAKLIHEDAGRYGFASPPHLWTEEQAKPTVRAVVKAEGPMWALDASIVDLVFELKERMGNLEALRDAHPELDEHHMRVLEVCRAGYERHKAAASALDFADLAPMVVCRMTAEPVYRRSVASRFQAVLIDEFQDLNPSQAAFLEQLLSEGASLWAVGDDDQCLYGFRAADPRRLVEFESCYTDAFVTPLTGNRRCGSEIVKAAQSLIANNRSRRKRPRQESTTGTLGVVSFEQFDTDSDEASRLLELAHAARSDRRSFAVLGRADWRLRSLRDVMRRQGHREVELLTVHQAKGLEWDVVALVGFEEGSMPAPRARDVEEERRVAYVGMTRARSSLHLTCVRRREGSLYGRWPGPFWEEAQGRTSQHVPPPVTRRAVVQVNDTVWIEVPGSTKLVDRLVTSRVDFIDGQMVGKGVGDVVRMNPKDPSRTGKLVRIDKFQPRRR